MALIDPEATSAPARTEQSDAALPRPRTVPMGSTAVRLLRKVQVDPETGCWNWSGSITPGGYGQIGIGSLKDGSRRLAAAHRVAYEIFVGAIPVGYQLDHLCRNRRCIHPNHLQPVTHAENVRRGEAGRHWAQKTHCPHGHPYDDENTRSYKGRRFCRECGRIKERRRYAAMKAASNG